MRAFSGLPLFVDIDGTLTDRPGGRGGAIFRDRVCRLIEEVSSGREVVVWTGGGTRYARAFCESVGLRGVLAIGKPAIIVDDNPNIRPPGRMSIVTPEEFFRPRRPEG